LLKKCIKLFVIPVVIVSGVLAIIMNVDMKNKTPAIAQGGDPVPEGATCYAVGPAPNRDMITVEYIQYQLDNLEKQYKDKKINYQTYKTRKEALETTLKELEEETKGNK